MRFVSAFIVLIRVILSHFCRTVSAVVEQLPRQYVPWLPQSAEGRENGGRDDRGGRSRLQGAQTGAIRVQSVLSEDLPRASVHASDPVHDRRE